MSGPTPESHPVEWTVFQHIDKDNSGVITPDEMHDMLEYLGEGRNAANFMKMMDPNRDGQITFLEFCKGYKDFMKRTRDRAMAKTVAELELQIVKAIRDQNYANVRAAFKDFDKDRNNNVTMDELTTFVTGNLSVAVAPGVLQDFMDKYDTIKNQKFSYIEFAKVCEDGIETKPES